MKIFKITVILLFLSNLAYASNEEEIIKFYSTLKIEQDTSITIVEDIQIIARGKKTKNGITRHLPIIKHTKSGLNEAVKYKIISVTKNGADEEYQIKFTNNDEEIIHIGAKEASLKPGIYDYQIKYKIYDQLFFFETFDEIYWDIIGDKWDLPIEHILATIILPNNASTKLKSAYKKNGEIAENFETYFDDDNNLIFSTTNRLEPKSNFIIAATFDKGIVKEQGLFAKLLHYQKYLLILGGLFLYYYAILLWLKRNPHKTARPTSSPPADYSPAATHYLQNIYNCSKPKLLAIALFSLAVKKHIKIIAEKSAFGEKIIRIQRLKNPKIDNLSVGERIVIRNLLGQKEEYEFDNRTDKKNLKNFLNIFLKILKTEFGEKYFSRNLPFVIIGFIFTLFIIKDLWGPEIIMLIPPILILASARLLRDKKPLKLAAIGLISIATLSIIIYFRNLYPLLLTFDFIAPAIALGANLAFCDLAKSKTSYGKRMSGLISNFKLHLEADANNKEITPEIFEKHLPFAIALGTLDSWSNKLKNHLEKNNITEYEFSWYEDSESKTPIKSSELSEVICRLSDKFEQNISNSS